MSSSNGSSSNNQSSTPSKDKKFTYYQQRIMDVLADGMPHTREQLRLSLQDEQATLQNLASHLTHIRKIIRPGGRDIICEYYNRGIHYRYVQLIKSSIE